MEDSHQNYKEQANWLDPVKEIVADSLEVIMDSQLDEGILKELPVIGSILKTFKAAHSLKDHIFLRKLGRFLMELDSIPVEKRTTFWANYQDDKAEKQQLGEQLIIYLDRHDTIDKAVLLARAFGAYITGSIDKVDFLDLAVVIDSVQTHHLEAIVSILNLAGRSYGFYQQISVQKDWQRFILELEVQRLLEYEDEIKTEEDKYFNKSVTRVHRKHRLTSLALHFLSHVVPELSEDVAAKIKEFYDRINRHKLERMQQEEEAFRRNNL